MARESAVTKQWRERAQNAETMVSSLERVLGAIAMGETAYAVESDLEGGEYALWFPAAPDGGVLVHTFKCYGQRPEVRARLFEDEYREMKPYWKLSIREALTALRAAQYRAVNETAA